MRQPRIQKVNMPTATLISKAFPHIDYADSYRVQLPDGAPSDLDAVVRAALGAAPRWVSLLMQLRDGLVGMIGLKTAKQLAQREPSHGALQVGDRLGIFRVMARSADELLLGEDDRHLDFRLSVLIRNDRGADWAIISTIVRFNNWLGQAYFLPVRPFHKLIVPALLRSAYQRYSGSH